MKRIVRIQGAAQSVSGRVAAVKWPDRLARRVTRMAAIIGA